MESGRGAHEAESGRGAGKAESLESHRLLEPVPFLRAGDPEAELGQRFAGSIEATVHRSPDAPNLWSQPRPIAREDAPMASLVTSLVYNSEWSL